MTDVLSSRLDAIAVTGAARAIPGPEPGLTRRATAQASLAAPVRAPAPCGTRPLRPGHRLWPDASNYNVIVAAVAARSQALHLRAWNEKAYAAELALRTLITLAGQIRTGKCAGFVAHIYDELTDLSQAYPGEDWRPLVAMVAHDPSVASQCKPAPPLAASKLQAALASDLNLAW